MWYIPIMVISRKSASGTMGTTYKYLIYGHFHQIHNSYQGTMGTINKYLIYGHFTKSKAQIAW